MKIPLAFPFSLPSAAIVVVVHLELESFTSCCLFSFFSTSTLTNQSIYSLSLSLSSFTPFLPSFSSYFYQVWRKEKKAEFVNVYTSIHSVKRLHLNFLIPSSLNILLFFLSFSLILST